MKPAHNKPVRYFWFPLGLNEENEGALKGICIGKPVIKLTIFYFREYIFLASQLFLAQQKEKHYLRL